MNIAARIHDTTRRALAAGALQPIETEACSLEDDGVRFIVRAVSSLARKAQATRGPAVADPLGDFDPDLFVGEAGPAHHVLLNKFPVLAGHVLLVVRRFEPQENLLTLADFEALHHCTSDWRALAFYNGGTEAGASQPRRHLQLVPLPLEAGHAHEVPMAARFAGHDARLPFRHAFARLSAGEPATALYARYRALLQEAGIAGLDTGQGERQSAPYNLLVAPEWMLLVPRSRAAFENVPVNALGFAGSMFVRAAHELERVRAIGPMRVLSEVGIA